MAKKIVIKLFNEEDVRESKEARKQLADVLPFMDAAEECGVQCQAFKDVRKQLDDNLKAIEAHFMKPSQVISDQEG